MNQPQPRILVIDDDPAVREMVATSLAQDGVELVAAGTGREGLQLSQSGPYDLVLLDLGLPEMDGFTVLQELKANHLTAGIPVVVLTAWASVEKKVRCFE